MNIITIIISSIGIACILFGIVWKILIAGKKKDRKGLGKARIFTITGFILAWAPLFINAYYQKIQDEKTPVLLESELSIKFTKPFEYKNWSYVGIENEMGENGISQEIHSFEKELNNDLSEKIYLIPQTYSFVSRQERLSTEEMERLEKLCEESGGEKVTFQAISFEGKKAKLIICNVSVGSYKFMGLMGSVALDEKNTISITLTSFAENFEQNKKDLEYILSKMEVIPKPR